MSISTKTGDGGQTGLFSGERVNKDDIRVEAYGTIDELNSFIGEVKHFVCPEVRAIIEEVHADLFRVAAELASVSVAYRQPISEADADRITEHVHHYEAIVKLKGFVIPGSILVSGKLDICRTISRRAERRIVTLSRNAEVGVFLRKYVNRLSDLLFIMARYEEFLVDKIIYH